MAGMEQLSGTYMRFLRLEAGTEGMREGSGSAEGAPSYASKLYRMTRPVGCGD